MKVCIKGLLLFHQAIMASASQRVWFFALDARKVI